MGGQVVFGLSWGQRLNSVIQGWNWDKGLNVLKESWEPLGPGTSRLFSPTQMSIGGQTLLRAYVRVSAGSRVLGSVKGVGLKYTLNP